MQVESGVSLKPYNTFGLPALAHTLVRVRREADVRAVVDHPAVLMWALGNEWNYNGLYTNLSHADSLARINEAAALVEAADTAHPVITVYGEVPTAATLGAMPAIDVWGINAYRGIGFGDLFTTGQGRSEKPMCLSEYGADAYNANLPGYDPMSQAEATAALTEELLDQSSALTATGVTLGGSLSLMRALLKVAFAWKLRRLVACQPRRAEKPCR